MSAIKAPALTLVNRGVVSQYPIRRCIQPRLVSDSDAHAFLFPVRHNGNDFYPFDIFKHPLK